MSGSIRRRLISSFVLFALALGTLFAAVSLWVFYRVEDRLARQRLQQMLEAGTDEPEPAALYFVGSPAAAPEPFAQKLEGVAPGFYEWEEGDRETHILLTDDPATAEHRVAIVSFTESESAQTRFALALWAGVGVTSLLALWLARYLAMRIVSPIEHLTERLATAPPDQVLSPDLERRLKDDEVAMLARALQRAGAELTASAERERRFLREASHELRTPITVIQGVSDLLRESVDSGDDLTRKRLERLERSLRRMNTSVLSLLAMARAEHRMKAAELPPFAQQLQDLVEEARSLAGPGVEVRSELVAEPRSDKAPMLIVLLSNLARNAVQHTRGGTVHVRVAAERAEVIDQGPGLPVHLVEQLKHGGPQPDIGIGLATVQRICRRFGWRLEVRCPAEGGTTISVDLKPEGRPSDELPPRRCTSR